MLNTPRTGAHTHVGVDDMPYLRRYYHSIFVPFCEWLESHNSEWLVDKFGSSFRGYACKINRTSDVYNHSNVVNMQHEHTIEFRLPRITGYKQYMQVIKFWREVGLFLNTFDFDKEAEAGVRLEKARKAGEGVVSIAKKWFE